MDYKDFYIKPDSFTPSNFRISTVGKGGKIPVYLSGLFTSEQEAISRIDAYLSNKNKTRGKANGEEDREG